MAGSDQKTQIATELPPEVANALAGRHPVVSSSPAPNITGARTVIAEAPQLPPTTPSAVSGGGAPPMAPPPMAPPPMAPPPAGPPPSYGAPVVAAPAAAGARTVIASAPSLPSSGPGPGGGSQAATVYSMPAPSIPPGQNLQSTMPPGAARPSAGPPVQLRPAGVVFPLAAPAAGMPPTARWIIGPVIAIVVALITTAIANRVWPPTSAPSSGPSFLSATRKVTILIEQPGAEVTVDGQVVEKKNPKEAEIKGDIGKTAAIRITLAGYEPFESRIMFTKDVRPPLRVRLLKPGEKPVKAQDPTAFDPRQGVKNPDDEDDQADTADKADTDKGNKADKGDKSDKADTDKGNKADKGDKSDKSDKADKGDKPEGDEDTGEEKKGHRHHGDKGDKGDKSDKADKGDKGDKIDKHAKGSITVMVRPWAIVYVDGKKIQQTPMRDYALSPGSHTLILENANKGKREVLKIKVGPGEKVAPISRTWD
jgi:hypothetical protein